MRCERIQIPQMALRWWVDSDLALNAGLVAWLSEIQTSIVEKLCSFVIFQGGGEGVWIPCPQPLWICKCHINCV